MYKNGLVRGSILSEEFRNNRFTILHLIYLIKQQHYLRRPTLILKESPVWENSVR